MMMAFRYNLINKSNWYIRLMFILAAAVFLFVLFIRFVLVFQPNSEIGGVENNVILSLIHHLSGLGLYKDFTQAPYMITQYSPLYYYIVGWGAKLFNIKPDNILALYALSRSFSLLFNLLYAYLGYRMAKKIFSISTLNSFIVFTLLFVLLEKHSFGRPDSLFSLLMISSVFAYLKFLQSETNTIHYLILSSVLSVLAIFTKQTGIIMSVILGCHLLFFNRNRKNSIISIISMALSGALLLLLFGYNNFGAFFQNIIGGLNNGVYVLFTIEKFIKEFFLIPLGITVVSFGVYFVLRYIFSGKPVFSFLSLTILLLFLFAFLTSFKYGSTISYYNEFWMVVIICLFIPGQLNINVPGVSVLFAALLISCSIIYKIEKPELNSLLTIKYNWKEYRKAKEIADFMRNDLRIGDGEYVLVDNRWRNKNFINLFLYKNIVMPNQDIIYVDNVKPVRFYINVFDYTDFCSKFDKGGILYLVRDNDPDELTFLDRKLIQYKPIKQFKNFTVYKFDNQSISSNTNNLEWRSN